MNEASLSQLSEWLRDQRPSRGFPSEMKIKYNEQTKEILGFAYQTPGYATRLNRRLGQAIRNVRKNVRPNDQRRTLGAFNVISDDLLAIAAYLAHIPQFRVVWDTQFPKKKKPITFTDKVHKLMRNLETDKAQEQYLVHAYDVKKRIERLIGFQLVQDPQTNMWWPHFAFTKVVSTFKNKPIYIWMSNDLAKKQTFQYEGKTYDTQCAIQAFNAEKRERILIPSFFKNRYHSCKHCGTQYQRTVPLRVNKNIDARCCPGCSKMLDQYKQPQWNVENIYHNAYHSNRSGWQFTICRLEHEDSLPIGLELETEFMTNKLNKTRNQLVYELWTALGRKDIVFERDGSLNESGVECITNPMTAEYARVYWGNARKELETLTNGIYSGVPGHAQGHQTNSWGAHLTFARKYWSDVALAKFTNFMTNSETNQDFVQAMAQRVSNYQGNTIGTKQVNKKANAQFPYNKNAIGPGEKIIGGPRASSINLTKQKLVEVRMFQTVGTYLELMKNYDFLTAMHVWLMNYPVSFQPSAKDFVEWLCEKGQAERHKRFKYLIKYLQQPEFRIRDNAGNNNRVFTRENTFRKVADSVKFPSNVKF